MINPVSAVHFLTVHYNGSTDAPCLESWWIYSSDVLAQDTDFIERFKAGEDASDGRVTTFQKEFDDKMAQMLANGHIVHHSVLDPINNKNDYSIPSGVLTVNQFTRLRLCM